MRARPTIVAAVAAAGALGAASASAQYLPTFAAGNHVGRTGGVTFFQQQLVSPAGVAPRRLAGFP